MSLFQQLKLLMWKNFVIRRRQKLRVCVEVLWPLSLFILLMLVRSKGLYLRVHQCHFEDKPLPSAGQFLFWQGLVCSFNNTCHQNRSEAERNYSDIRSSEVSLLLNDAQAFTEMTMNRNEQQFEKLIADIDELSAVLNKTQESADSSRPPRANSNWTTISPSFDDGSEEKSNLTNLRNPKLKQILAMHRNINATLNELEPYMEITSLLKRINVSYENITDIIKEVPEVNNIFVRLHKFMCGNSSDVTIEKMLEPRHSVDNLRGYLNSIQDAPAVIEYQYDKELSKECNAVYKHLETSPHLKFVWRFLKPFVRGRIVYAPNITVIRRVMSRIKRYTDTPKFSSFKKERGDLKIDPRMYNTTLEKLKDLLKFYDNLNQSDNSDSKELREAFEPTIQKSFDFLKTYQEAMHGLSNEKLANIGKQISEVLKCYTSINIEHYATEEEAEKRSMELSEKNELLAQITFNNTRTDNLDPFVRYKIRMNAERMYYSSMFSLSNGPNYKPFEDLKLITFGFVYLQDIVERSIIREHTNRTDIPGYVMKQMPHPCFVEDWFLSSLGGMFPMFMVLSWVYTASMIIKSIVYEKEQKLQETMQALGMNEGIHWCSWFFDCIIPMVITVFVLSTVLVYGGVVANAEYTLVVSFLLCYAVSTITMCFLVSVFFSKANLAASSGGIIFFITYLPFPLIDAWFPQVSPAFKEIGSLLSNVALGMGSKYFALRELEGTGAKWSNVGTSPIAGDRFSISKIMFIFIIDALLYFTFAWYIGNVFPGSYGIPKNWYFPFTISYWCPSAKRVKEEEVQSEKDNVYQDSDTIEADPLHLERGVAIKQMTKIYKGGKVAIEDLSLNFYQDQITAFLGTNGAGKTTTISILTGLFPPSKGTAEIYGQDVRYQMNLIRRSLGICPQYNILFLELTVQEHLWFFARLKGHTLGEVQVEMQTILTDLGLYNKKDTYARHLSGGMKRKLSIAIAFIGKSRTVVLDEPTAGVDPFSRMGIWNLLIKYKRGRTIILTTHNMAEADLLGDRIAIVDGGKLVCCGSNTFLKSRFGWGYVLTVDLNLSYAPNKSDTMLYNELLDGISRIVPGSRVIEKFGTEIKVNLPPVSSNIQIYESLFEYLLSNKEKCGISSFGFSDTSLEEIFLKLTSENKEQDQVSKEESNQSIKDGKYASDFEFCQNGSGRATLPNQLKTMLLKRVWRNRRNKMELCMQLLLPAILVGICMSITSNLVLIHQPEPLVADIIRCPRGTTGMPPVCTSFYQLLPESSNRSQKYLDTLKGPTGIGTGCVNGSGNKDHNCGKSLLIAEVRPENNHSIDDCSCEKGRFTCNFNSSLGHPEIVQTGHGFSFYNLTGKDIENWILTTFESLDSNSEKRVTKKTGGYTFGIQLMMKGRDLSTQFDTSQKMTRNRSQSHFFERRTHDNSSISGAVQNYIKKAKTDRGRTCVSRRNCAKNKNQLSRGLDKKNGSDLEKIMINISGKRDVPTSDSDINDNIKIWFNNKWPISPVVYLNGINNVILRALMPKNVSANYGIQVTMQGMNLTAKQMQTKISQKATSSLLHSICLLFSLSFVPASFTIYLIEERISGCKHLQLLSGVNWAVYWIHVYLWDLVCHTISALFCIVTLLCFQEEAYVGSRSLPCLTLLVLLFGWSSIPMMYPATFFFQVPSSAFVALASFNISIGVLTTASTYVLRLFEDEYLRVMRTALSNIFLIFPHFCLGDGLMKLSESYFLTTALAGFDVKVRVNLLAWNYLGKNLVFMFLEGIVFFIAVLCYERFQRSMGLCTEQPMSLEPPMNLDGDVDNERERILNLGGKDEVLVLKCLTKVYKSRKHIAVNQLCLGVGKGQCFGLIGLNGAGKTSTFKMLTGDTGISFGDATVLGHSVRDNLTSVRSLIGYCPQFDALDSKLTPEEHLRLYASLRNIPKNQIPQVVNCCLTRFDLWGYRNVCSLYLSGGNKRKLSTAIAMMGDPQLIFLDEPTCGMDPKARRFLWSRVKECVARGRAVVMTSHSMSECEALCSRLSIMVSGQFMCLGSIQHLKSKFGKGYNLVVRAPLEKIGLAKKLISGKIPEAIEKSEHYTQVKYHVDVETFSLFNILTVLEDARENQLILDYSLSQKSLGEVFVHFVSHQALAKQHDVINRWDCCRLFCCPGKLVTTSHISSSDDFPHRNPSNQTSNGSFQNAQRQ